MLQCNVHFYFETINSALGLLYSSTQLSTAQNDLITVQTNHATKRNETNFSVARCGPREHPNVWSCDPANSNSEMFRKVHMAVWPHVEWSKNVRYHSKQTCSKNFEQILSQHKYCRGVPMSNSDMDTSGCQKTNTQDICWNIQRTWSVSYFCC